MTSNSTYSAASTSRETFSLRYVMYFFGWMCLWQGTSVPGSIFQLEMLSYGADLQLQESILILSFLAFLVERWVQKDYSLKSSYFWGPLLVIVASLVFSWIRGQFVMQTFRPVWELHEAPLIPLAFFLFVNAFRDVTERKVLLWLFMVAALMKVADAVWVRTFPSNTNVLWGALLMWRDGFILAVGIAGALIMAHYRGLQYKKLRTFALISAPFLAYGLLISYRRTFIIALFIASIVMCVTIGKGRRKKQLRNFLVMLFLIVGVVLFTEPLDIIARMAGAFMPTEEGSSYIRLMELPNIMRNITENPIFGVPIGVQWEMYYHIPLFANHSRLGTHNTYLYWPLRMGIPGAFGFLWLLARVWKALLINWRIQKTEEDFAYNHFLLYAFFIYNLGCFLGLMYSDAMSIMTAMLLVMLQLQMRKVTGLESLKHVDFWRTIRYKKIVFRPKIELTPEGAALLQKMRAS